MFNLRNDLESTVKYFPKLEIIESENGPFLLGEVDILHPIKNEIIDTFTVEIIFPRNYPYCFPNVTETSGKIERIPDRHIYTNTNNLCFSVFAEERIKCYYGITTKWFIDHVLVPRLAEEYIVNQGGKYTHEYSHGQLGDLEFYLKKFCTGSPTEVMRYLNLILEVRFPKHYEKCGCGSGKKFKKCHRVIFEDLKRLGDKFIVNEIFKLEKLIQTLNNTPKNN